MFGPDEPKNLDPVWSKPPQEASGPILPWQANLPSFYTNWSPTSTRKLAKPAANWVPTGQPSDPTPVHFNRASPSRSPAIYRRVMFRPQNILHSQPSMDLADEEAPIVNTSNDNKAQLQSNETTSNDKTNEALKSGDEPSVTDDTRAAVNDSCSPVPNGSPVSDESRSKPPWRRQPSVESTAMVSIPSKPIQRTPTSPPPSQGAEQYQNVPWRSPQSNRRMFAKLKSPSLSVEETDTAPPQRKPNFMRTEKETSSNITPKKDGDNGTHATQPTVTSPIQPIAPDQKVTQDPTPSTTVETPAPTSSISPATPPTAIQTTPVIQSSSDEKAPTGQLKDQEESKTVNAEEPPTSTPSEVSALPQEPAPQPPQPQEIAPDVVQGAQLAPPASECTLLNIVEHDPPEPPIPPPPPRTSSAKPPKGNPIEELLANIVRYESIDEARHATHLVEDRAQQEQRTPSPDYERAPVTNRIQKFEKQASIEKENAKVLPQAKPVGPWVKKTSSGPVAWGEREPIRTHEQTPNSYQSTMLPPSSHNVILSRPSEPCDQWNYTGKGVLGQKGESSDAFVGNDNAGTILRSNEMDTNKDGEDLFDPWCDPQNPRVIQFQDISAAAFKIKSGIINTPCTYSNMSSIIGCEIFFKKEFNQYTGSFKERGARYTLLCLTEDQRKKGVIAASAGNHALALSYHGRDLGIPVTVVMPIVAPIMKVQACRQYGANVLVQGVDIGECREIALRQAKESQLLYLNGYDHPHILAGQGTMGLEIVEQVPNIDAVVVPVGGGGLIAGVALAVKSLYPNVQVIGVEAERCASFTAAMESKKPVTVQAETTLADGLAVPCVGVNAFATASSLIDKIVTVKEEWIAIAILRLVEMEKAVVEGAGAAGLAAILAGALPELKGKRVVIPLCGGNIDTTILGRCLERGLAADGRLVKFTVTVSDRPGGIAELTRLLCNLGVSIKDMLHERAWIRNDIFSVEVKVVCETRDYEHFLQLRTELEKKYSKIRFPLPIQVAHT